MKRLFIYIIFSLIIIGCNGEETVKAEKVNLPSIDEIPKSTWQKLSQKKIYFGHQSVGDNMIDGINKIMETNDAIKLNIKRSNDAQTFNIPVFAHSYIGKNKDIDSKFADFSQNIREGIGDKVDIAFLKLCYWDVRRKTNVEEVFNNYKKTITGLQKKYPKTVFVHLTVPLMLHSDGIVSKIKRMIRPNNNDLGNIKRNELSRLILQEYGGKEPLFDIALIESTLQDGSRAFFSKGGKNYYYLADEHGKDDGHLNDIGRKHVAEQLLITLARIAEEN